MSHLLISRNPDLKRLRDEGYEVEIRAKHLLVHHVPYVTSQKAVAYGTLVCALTMAGDNIVAPESHVAYFIGECPCDKDGAVLSKVVGNSTPQKLAERVEIQHLFSSKPVEGYKGYYEKMKRYIDILTHQAWAWDENATALTGRIIDMEDDESVFHYPDTSSSRAGIEVVANKLANQKIGIVGVGGTGSYVLDFIAKTRVKEIHLFDGDKFLNHNAFRAPGAPSKDELSALPLKVDYFKNIYSKMHKGIVAHGVYMDESNVERLRGLNFVFLCMDRGGDKRLVVERLDEWGVSFIDVGMGVQEVDGALRGVLRVTTRTPQKRDHLQRRIPFNEGGANDYSSNIQIAELNALNAVLALVKWKKLCGFYHDLEKEHFSTYNVTVNDTTNEEHDEAANRPQA